MAMLYQGEKEGEGANDGQIIVYMGKCGRTKFTLKTVQAIVLYEGSNIREVQFWQSTSLLIREKWKWSGSLECHIDIKEGNEQ